MSGDKRKMLEQLSKDYTYKKLTEAEQKSRGILGRLVGVIADTSKPTRNGRRYTKPLWENVFNDPIMQEKIANRCVLGELGHPEDRSEIDIEKVAICLAEVPKFGEDGKLYGVFDILPTPNGKILKALCDYGCNVGISSRGQGDLETDYEGNESVIPESYQCECFDVVLVPGVKEARLKLVNESLDRNSVKLKKVLTESYNNASDEDKKIMKETLSSLNINLTEDKKEDSDYESLKIKIENLKEGDPEIVVDKVEDEATFGFNTLHIEKNKDEYYRIWDENEKGEGANLTKFSDLENTLYWVRRALGLEKKESLEEDKKEEVEKTEEEIIDNNDESKVSEEEEVKEESSDEGTEEDSEDIESTEEEEKEEETQVESEGGEVEDDEFKEKFTVAFETWKKGWEDKNEKEFPEISVDDLIEFTQVMLDTIPEEEIEQVAEVKIDTEEREEEEAPSEDIAAEDTGAVELVDSLKEALEAKSVLEETSKDLQAKLAVSDTKVEELEEKCEQYEKALQRLSTMAKKGKDLEEEVTSLKESLQAEKQTVAGQKQRIERLVKAKNDVAKNSAVITESVSAKSKELNALNEELKSQKALLENTKKEYEEKLKKVTEGLEKDKSEAIKTQNKLVENLNKEMKLKEGYKNFANKAANKYIEVKATMLGLSSRDIKRKLGESYTLDDVDQVCESLKEYQLNVNRLPFGVNDKVSFKVNESRPTPKLARSQAVEEDDSVSESLWKLANL